MVSRSYVIGLPVIVTVEDGPPWEDGPRVRYEVDTSEAGIEVSKYDPAYGYTEEETAQDAIAVTADHVERRRRKDDALRRCQLCGRTDRPTEMIRGVGGPIRACGPCREPLPEVPA